MKKLFNLLLLTFLTVALAVPLKAYAGSTEPLAPHPDHYVTDDADLLTESECAELDEHLKALSSELNLDIVVVTTHDLEGKTPEAYCDDFYDYSGYGPDEQFSGICFLRYISEDGRDYDVWISTCGKAISVFTDYAIQRQIDLIADDIIDGNYFRAFYNFGDNVKTAVEAYEDALNRAVTDDDFEYDDPYEYYPDIYVPYDPYRRPVNTSYNPIWLAVAIGVGLIVGFSVTSVLKSQLLSVAPATNATGYIKLGSFKLNRQSDNFLYKRVSAVPIPQETTSSGGSHHSTTHHSSSGRSHGGGGRHI